MKRLAFLLAAAFVLELAFPPRYAAAAEALRSPFTAIVQRDMSHGAASSGACTPALPVPRDLFGVSYYVDSAHHSIADPALQKKNVEQLKPVRDYLAGIVRMTDAAVQGSASDGDCAFAWFQAGATSGGLLGDVNRQGGYEREWTLCGLALEYLKLRDTGRLSDGGARATVELWLDRIARAVRPVAEKENERNNHAYWTGLGVAAAGIAANDRELFEWGISKYTLGDGMIAADGTLPLEMARGRRALHYHFYALAPLVMLAELGEANGLDLYARSGGALHRLVKRVVAGFHDPSWFASRAGVAQDIAANGSLAVDEAGWMEPYSARFGPSDLSDILQKFRPVIDPRYGGNVTALYAAASKT